MITENQIHKFLKELTKMYQEEYGESHASLNDFTFSLSVCQKNKKLMKIVVKKYSLSAYLPGIIEIFNELHTRNYLENHPDGTYSLTKNGYALGSQSHISNIINYFNLNPGLSTVIAIFALIISAIALCVSIGKP